MCSMNKDEVAEVSSAGRLQHVIYGPFQLHIDYEMWKRIYHGQIDHIMRKVMLLLVVPFDGLAIEAIKDGLIPGLNNFLRCYSNDGDFWDACLIVSAAVLVTYFFVRPSMLFFTREAEARSFFELRGVDVGSPDSSVGYKPVDSLSVDSAVTVTDFGVEERVPDGSVLRVPFYQMSKHLHAGRGVVVFIAGDIWRDSLVYNMIDYGWTDRMRWDGNGIAVPLELVGSRRKFLGDMRRRIRDARRRTKRLRHDLDHADGVPSADVLRRFPELAWLADGEEVNAEVRRRREAQERKAEETPEAVARRRRTRQAADRLHEAEDCALAEDGDDVVMEGLAPSGSHVVTVGRRDEKNISVSESLIGKEETNGGE